MDAIEAEDDRQLRAMVALIEAQAEQVSTLRAAVDRLEGMLALRAELDTMVAHEVRTPLTVVHGVLITLGLLPADHPDRPALMDQALEHTRRLSETVKHLLVPPGEPVPTVDRSALELVAFAVVADHVVDELGHRFPDIGVVLDLPADLLITTSLPRLESLLVHLLEHASARAGAGAVELRASRVEELLRIEIVDRGGPLPEPVEDCFTPGAQAMDPYLARMLARSMGGDVTLQPRTGGGCKAVVELPQRRSDDALG